MPIERAIRKCRLLRGGLADKEELFMVRDGIRIKVGTGDTERDVLNRYMDEKRRLRDESIRQTEKDA